MGFVSGPAYQELASGPDSWIVQDWLPSSGMLNVYGAPKLGKSFFTLQLAEAVANPKRLWCLNMPVLQHGPVAYLQIDTPRSLWKDRLRDLKGTDMDFTNVYFADTLITPFPFDILSSGFSWLKEACAEMLAECQEPPVLVVVDTMRESYSGEENDSSIMRNVVNLFKSAVGEAALCFVSHARKNEGDDSSLMGGNRGSSYLAGRMDCVIRLNEKNIQYQGRAVGLETIKVRRTSNYLVEVADEFEVTLRALIESNPTAAARTIARQLQEQFPKRNPETIRSAVRRSLASRPEGTRAIRFDD